MADSMHSQLPLPDSFGLKTILSNAHQPIDSRTRAIQDAVAEWYRQRDYAPAWVTRAGVSPKAQNLLTILTESWRDGLEPRDYNIEKIEQLWHLPSPANQATLDLLLSEALALYLVDNMEGVSPPPALQKQVYTSSQSLTTKVVLHLKQAAATDNLAQYIALKQPGHHQYQELKKGLARYHALANSGGFPTVPSGPILEPGMVDTRIPVLIQRLQKEGFLQDRYTPAKKNHYSPRVVAAIRAFQRTFNLPPDGIIGCDTIIALNTSPATLIQRIRINMERWRWVSRQLTGKQILVNIAAYQLTVLNDGKPDLHLPVIVGHLDNKTPLFKKNIRSLVINPYWNVPLRIVEEELLPNQIADPHYFQDNHFRIFEGRAENRTEIDPQSIDWRTIGKGIRRYRVRQDPGPQNSLGQLKFIFPNKHNIYLHGTPSQNLFASTNRAYSHGCIRVSQPIRLAHYLLQANRRPWSLQQIQAVMNSGAHTVVLLDTPIPVQMLYMTVYADPETKTLTFYRDIYTKDTQLTNRFFAGQ